MTTPLPFTHPDATRVYECRSFRHIETQNGDSSEEFRILVIEHDFELNPLKKSHPYPERCLFEEASNFAKASPEFAQVILKPSEASLAVAFSSHT